MKERVKGLWRISQRVISFLLILVLTCQNMTGFAAEKTSGLVFCCGFFFDSLEDAVDEANKSNDDEVTITLYGDVLVSKKLVL